VYSDDYAAHWSPSSPQYQWLAADLAAHPSGIKFAFFHYPLHSDQKAQNSDTYLQGPSSLEGLLASNHVSVAFSGHAHIYERNTGTAPGSLPNYVTGGGGGTLQPVAEAGCSSVDAYSIGWSPTKLKGSRCGAAAVPDSAARVFHFLKVTVNGSSVTVAPTDELGRTFDVQTYSLNPVPDTLELCFREVRVPFDPGKRDVRVCARRVRARPVHESGELRRSDRRVARLHCQLDDHWWDRPYARVVFVECRHSTAHKTERTEGDRAVGGACEPDVGSLR
jgi:hypothetical protein